MPNRHAVRTGAYSKVQTKVSKGQFLPTDLEDMYPYLDRKEYFQNILFDKE